jgi:hypothetical protein
MKRQQTAKEKELADNVRLRRAWKQYHKDLLKEALTGRHTDIMQQLMARIKELRSARELVAFIEMQDWGAIDANTCRRSTMRYRGSRCARSRSSAESSTSFPQ